MEKYYDWRLSVSTAAFFAFQLLLVFHSVACGAQRPDATHACDAPSGTNEACTKTLAKGESVVIDCTGATKMTVPTQLFAPSAHKVCKGEITGVEGNCTEEAVDQFLNVKFDEVTSNWFRITNENWEGDSTVISGSCADDTAQSATKSSYFNVTLPKPSDTSPDDDGKGTPGPSPDPGYGPPAPYPGNGGGNPQGGGRDSAAIQTHSVIGLTSVCCLAMIALVTAVLP